MKSKRVLTLFLIINAVVSASAFAQIKAEAGGRVETYFHVRGASLRNYAIKNDLSKRCRWTTRVDEVERSDNEGYSNHLSCSGTTECQVSWKENGVVHSEWKEVRMSCSPEAGSPYVEQYETRQYNGVRLHTDYHCERITNFDPQAQCRPTKVIERR